jgi:ankyrin repeat protein
MGRSRSLAYCSATVRSIDEQDGEGKTPFQVASSHGRHEIMKLLLEQGAVPP